MATEKPNYRPNRKNGLSTRNTFDLHARKQTQRGAPSTLTVYVRNKGEAEANGERFASGVEYSLNKGRRWELDASDFEEDTHFARTKDADSKSSVRASRNAFFDHLANEPVDREPTSDDEEQSASSDKKKLSRKDRKANRAPKPKKLNTSLHNSHSAEVYAAGAAQVYVEMSETPRLAKIRTLKTHKEGREIQARTHKNQDLARMCL
jgi:hypothetical protein